jgi:DHA3 family tetracycline resistance protein-like MFS transporter
VYWETALQQDVPRELLARVISLDWMCSFALMPVGMALVGPSVNAFGREPVLWVAAVFAVVPPLLCLRVPGMLEFRTPAPLTESPQPVLR